MTSFHKTTCGKCGYPSLARKGRTLCCNVTLDYESKVKIKIYKRKRTGSARRSARFAGTPLAELYVSRQPDEGPDPDQLKLFGG
jgi:hypothetical protein